MQYSPNHRAGKAYVGESVVTEIISAQSLCRAWSGKMAPDKEGATLMDSLKAMKSSDMPAPVWGPAMA